MTELYFAGPAAWRMPEDAWLLAEGPDFPDLLDRLSTGPVGNLQPGRGAETVLTSGKGRIVARLFVGCTPSPSGHGPPQIWCYGDAGSAVVVESQLARYTFAEQLGLSHPEVVTFGLSGAVADALPDEFGVARPQPFEVFTDQNHRLWFGHDGLSTRGCCLVVPAAAAGDTLARIEPLLKRLGGEFLDETKMESRRIRAGLPRAGNELTEDYNPLEAGLGDAVDFKKGCYVGQEVVARLFNYEKVSRTLLRWTRAGAPPEVGARLVSASDESAIDPAPVGRPAGSITSIDPIADGNLVHGLAYIKNSVAGNGDRLVLADEPEGPLLTLRE